MSQAGSKERTDIVLAEYSALRAEVLKRMELCQGIYNFVFIAFGGTLGLGLEKDNATLVLLYPILALFLAIIWSSSNKQIHEVGSYIRFHIESKFGDSMRWEHCMGQINKNLNWKKWQGREEKIAAYLLFLGTELVALVIGIWLAWVSWKSPVLGSFLAGPFFVLLDVLCVVVTFVALHYSHAREISIIRHLPEVRLFGPMNVETAPTKSGGQWNCQMSIVSASAQKLDMHYQVHVNSCTKGGGAIRNLCPYKATITLRGILDELDLTVTEILDVNGNGKCPPK